MDAIMKLTLLLIFIAFRCHGMSQIDALSMLESGNNDFAHGRSHEVSRWQMLPSVWRSHTRLPLSASTNAITAQRVALAVLQERVTAFVVRYHREPTPFETYVLWNPRCPKETAQRFANLCHPPSNEMKAGRMPSGSDCDK